MEHTTAIKRRIRLLEGFINSRAFKGFVGKKEEYFQGYKEATNDQIQEEIHFLKNLLTTEKIDHIGISPINILKEG